MSSTDSAEKYQFYSNSSNKKTMIGVDVNEIIEKLFDSFLQKY